MSERKSRPGVHHKWRILFCILLLCAALLLYMTVNANVVRVLRTEIPVADLSDELAGFTVVYMSDLKLSSSSSLTRVQTLLNSLEEIHPQVLVLGGDYTGYDFIGQALNRRTNADYNLRMLDLRKRLFESLGAFSAPYGVFAVVGDQDNDLSRYDLEALSDIAYDYGVHLLVNESVSLPVPGRHRLIITGLDDWHTGAQSLNGLLDGLKEDDCVLVLTHTPDSVPVLLDQSGGNCVDVILSGHTLGGKYRLAGEELLNPLSDTKRFSAGWHREGNALLLISEGLNTNWPSLRFGTQPQVHVLTLVRKQYSQMEQ